MPDLNELSEREQEILRLVATGASNKEIASQLAISANTVKVHLRNIFGKLGVASRTEATLWAVRSGLVQPFEGQVELVAEEERDENLAVGATGELTVPEAPPVETRPVRPFWVLPASLLALAVILLTLVAFWLRNPPAANSSTPTVQVLQATWLERASLPEARSAAAVVVYQEQIYVLGGETAAGVSAAVLRYDPQNDQWQELAAKPTAVRYAGAAVLAGQILVPGGLDAAGKPSAVLEIYNPQDNRWSAGPDLPQPLADYALLAFEGRLYLFGGWDGSRVSAETYIFLPGATPAQGEWQRLTPLPAARRGAGAAQASGRIFVLGGQAADGTILNTNEIYAPYLDQGAENPWQAGMPLPEPRLRPAVSSVADLIYVIGGTTSPSGQTDLPTLQLAPSANLWQRLPSPGAGVWSDLGLVTLGTQLYALGGRVDGDLTGQVRTYQAIYTILVPIVR